MIGTATGVSCRGSRVRSADRSEEFTRPRYPQMNSAKRHPAAYVATGVGCVGFGGRLSSIGYAVGETLASGTEAIASSSESAKEVTARRSILIQLEPGWG